ncbi:MAG: hypothetical protein ACOX9R_17980 [Armatimonadota bacterium]|jgi:hypothetical protein
MRTVVPMPVIGVLSALLVIAASIHVGQSAPVEDRGGIPAMVTEEEALARAAEWAEGLGLRVEEWEVGRHESASGAFPVYYRVTSGDGRHEFRLDAYMGHFASWRDTEFPSRGDVTEDPTARELYVRVARDFISEHLQFLEPAVMVYEDNPRFWLQAIADDVVFTSNSARIHVALDSGTVHGFHTRRAELRVDAAPLISPEQCKEHAATFVENTPRVEIIDLDPELFPRAEWLRKYYFVTDDDAGVQRLNRTVVLRVSSEPGGPLVYDNGLMVINLDARTGEIFFVDGMAPGLRRPAIYLNGRLFYRPSFPPLTRGGVAHLAVNYLESSIWQGSVERTAADQMTVEYDGSTWKFTAGERGYRIDEEEARLRWVPLLEAEVFYLPLEAIELITGWSAEYSRADDAVYINSPATDNQP